MRIDRYGQAAPVVKTCLLYGSNNKIDLAVLDVLIRKAVSIRKTLGITVPLPILFQRGSVNDSSTIQTAIFKSLFEQPSNVQQLTLDLFHTGSPGSAESITKGKRSAVHPQMPMDLLGLLILNPG